MKIDRFKLTTEHGDVNITLDKRGKAASISCRFSINGKEFERSTKTSNPTLAKIKAKQIATDMLRFSHASGSLTLHKAIEWYLESQWPNPIDHAKKYHEILNNFKSKTQDFDLATARAQKVTETVQDFLDNRWSNENVKSLSTLHRDQRHLSAFFGFIKKRKHFWPINPALKEHLTLKPVTTKADKPIEMKLFTRFLDMAKNYEVFPVILLCMNGLRPKGATSIKWQDIDWQRNLIRTTEKRVERYVPLAPWIKDQLKDFRKTSGQVWEYGYFAAHRDVQSIRDEYDLPNTITLNKIRATGEWMMYEKGVAPQKSAKMMGHTIHTATRHYVNLEALSAHDAASELNPENFKPTNKPKQTRGKSRGKPNQKQGRKIS